MKKTLCLVMIVKNEENQLARCFSSVKDHIDTYCIIDTGSTDNTIEVIQKELSGIPGKVIERPWVNFGHNRTESLQLAKGMADYLLLSDADEQIIFENDFDSSKLTFDQYMIRYQGNLDYSVPYLIKGDIDWFFVGVTHEYLSSDQYVTRGSIETISILDHGDGGSKSDKFSRDIRLLEQGIFDEPNNTRYMFYLANSYRDIGNNTKAIEWYQKRIEAGGWTEEVTMSYESMGKCYSRLRQNTLAIDAWLKGYDYNPNRAECLYYAVNKLREDGRHKLAYNLAKIAKKIPYPKNDILFIDRSVYEWKIDYEISICAYYVDQKDDIRPLFKKILMVPSANHQNIISNYKWYCKSIQEFEENSFIYPSNHENWLNSSPCIFPIEDGYGMNIRKVSYLIDKNDGSYGEVNPIVTKGCINTTNSYVELNKDFSIRSQHEFQMTDFNLKAVNGIEDLKVIGDRFTATKWHGYGQIGIIHGKYDKSKDHLEYQEIESPESRDIEKNWVPYKTQDGLNYIYDWNPLKYGFINDDGLFDLTESVEFLPSFRGSTPGFEHDGIIYFLAHIVEYSTPRHYYHTIVRFDAKTFKYIDHSLFFTFEGQKIEYALGLIIEDERVIISHSVWDSTAQVKVYNKEKLFKEIF